MANPLRLYSADLYQTFHVLMVNRNMHRDSDGFHRGGRGELCRWVQNERGIAEHCAQAESLTLLSTSKAMQRLEAAARSRGLKVIYR